MYLFVLDAKTDMYEQQQQQQQNILMLVFLSYIETLSDYQNLGN